MEFLDPTDLYPSLSSLCCHSLIWNPVGHCEIKRSRRAHANSVLYRNVKIRKTRWVHIVVDHAAKFSTSWQRGVHLASWVLKFLINFWSLNPLVHNEQFLLNHTVNLLLMILILSIDERVDCGLHLNKTLCKLEPFAIFQIWIFLHMAMTKLYKTVN